MTFILVIDLFCVLYMLFFHGGAKSTADINTGGQTPYFSTKSQYFHCSFCPEEGGQTPLPISMGGPWPDLPPWIRHCPLPTLLLIYKTLDWHYGKWISEKVEIPWRWS